MTAGGYDRWQRALEWQVTEKLPENRILPVPAEPSGFWRRIGTSNEPDAPEVSKRSMTICAPVTGTHS